MTVGMFCILVGKVLEDFKSSAATFIFIRIDKLPTKHVKMEYLTRGTKSYQPDYCVGSIPMKP
jgi:hypothetical protein